MTCPATYAARRMHLSALATLDFDTSGKATPFYGSANPVFRSRRSAGKLPTLALTALHQREAMILDRNRAAKRMDTQEVHRLERDLRKLTNRILAKGVCSNGVA
jgi:hypothetical protein